MSQSLEERAISALLRDFSPSGNEECREIIETQLKSEEELEDLFIQLVKSYGPMHALTIQVFFHLFDVLIGLYRLKKCDIYLNVIQDGCISPESSTTNRIKWFQSLAFTRWKQGKLVDAMSAFRKIEDILHNEPSAALFENMAHTFSSMGQYDSAKQYFEKSLEVSGEPNGGLLLGLGLLYERTGDIPRGIELVSKALEWYESKFSAKDNESSLEAKCCHALSRMQLNINKVDEAKVHAERALVIFKRTCGDDSPLVTSALRTKAEILDKLEDHENALIAYIESIEGEILKDEVDLAVIVEVIQKVTLCFTKLPIARRSDASSLLIDRMERGCYRLESVVQCDGNIAAIFKLTAELAVYGLRLSTAKKLFARALPLFEKETSLDCSHLIEQCTQAIQIIESRSHTQ